MPLPRFPRRRGVAEVGPLVRGWLPPRRLHGLLEGLRRLLVRDRVAQPPGELVAPRLLLGDPHALGEAVLLIPRLGVGDQPTERAERFGEGRTFHAPRRAHREPPKRGHPAPVILP